MGDKSSKNNKTKVLKVIRNKAKNIAEFIEFKHADDQDLFDVIAINDMDTSALWNVDDFFKKHLKDLLLSGPASEKNPHMIIMRLRNNKPTKKPIRFMISYNKQKYDPIDEAEKDSIIMNPTGMKTVWDDFQALAEAKRKAFDKRFERVFGLNKSTFESDPILNQFKDHGLQFSKEALSNLLGGIGYYYGPV